MKKDISKRSYVEMYLITKEDKNLFDKCVLHLNKKTDEKLQSDITKVKDVAVQTENDIPDDSKTDKSDSSYHGSPASPWFRGFNGSPEMNEKENTDVTDKEVENKQETSKMPHSKKESKGDKKRKRSSPNKNKTSLKKFELFSTTYSPIRTRRRQYMLKRAMEKNNKYTVWSEPNTQS